MSCGRFGFLCLPDVRCSVFRVYLRVIRNASGFRIAPNKSEENRRTMKTQRNLETPDHYEHSESPITLGGKLSDNPPKPRGGSACATVPGGVGSPDPAAQQHFLRLVGLLRLVTVEVPGAPPSPVQSSPALSLPWDNRNAQMARRRRHQLTRRARLRRTRAQPLARPHRRRRTRRRRLGRQRVRAQPRRASRWQNIS